VRALCTSGGEALRSIWRRPEYRILYLGLLVTGVGSSCAMPLAALYLTNELHVPPSGVGLFFLVRLAGPAVSMGTGWLSDRVRDRLPLLRMFMAWLAAGWLLFGLATGLSSALTVSAVFLCFTGPVNAQFFTAVDDRITGQDERQRSTITSTLRGGNALGYVLGPALGGYLATAFGLRSVFITAAVLYLLAILSTWWLRAVTAGRERVPQGRSGPVGLPLLVCGAGITLILSGDAMKQGYLPVFVVDQLGHSPSDYGMLMSVSAVVELAVFPLAGMLADRIGMAKVIGGALLVGVADYVLLAVSSHLWQLYVVQVLHVAVIVAMYGVGISYLQRISPHRPGLASSAFFAAQGIATPFGGLLGSLGVGAFGLPGMFWVPAAFCLLCWSVFAMFAMFANREKTCA
jgi:SET family sugar efflux transporter-like MFS transporter